MDLPGLKHRFALWPYRGTVRRLLVQAKDQPHGAQAWALRRAAQAAWTRIHPRVQRHRRDALWCPAPPSRKRRLSGWYLPQFLGPSLAHVEGLAFRPLLRRRRQRRDQADLDGAERRSNLLGQFHVPAWRRKPPRSVCLFDDVSTTGATLLESARALRGAGVEEVRAVCVAVVG